MKKRPSMSDFGLFSFQGFAPEWSEQYKKQERYTEALGKWEKENETNERIQNPTTNDYTDCSS